MSRILFIIIAALNFEICAFGCSIESRMPATVDIVKGSHDSRGELDWFDVKQPWNAPYLSTLSTFSGSSGDLILTARYFDSIFELSWTPLNFLLASGAGVGIIERMLDKCGHKAFESEISEFPRDNFRTSSGNFPKIFERPWACIHPLSSAVNAIYLLRSYPELAIQIEANFDLILSETLKLGQTLDFGRNTTMNPVYKCVILAINGDSVAYRCVQKLLDAGASPNIEIFGYTALDRVDIALKYKEDEKLRDLHMVLLERGAKSFAGIRG